MIKSGIISQAHLEYENMKTDTMEVYRDIREPAEDPSEEQLISTSTRSSATAATPIRSW